MRISDWSSDVCSSDLQPPAARYQGGQQTIRRVGHHQEDGMCRRLFKHFKQSIGRDGVHGACRIQRGHAPAAAMRGGIEPGAERAQLIHPYVFGRRFLGDRKSTRLNSKSLMRISYAVFCLKKKL